MPTLWKEFPEINRKIAFTSNYVGANFPLGCHCGSIAGVSANFGTGYYAAAEGKNVAVLDTTKEPQIRYARSSTYDPFTVPKKEILEVIAHLKAIDFKFTDLYINVYDEIIAKCESIPLWVMSDVINYKAPARRVEAPGHFYEVYGSTGDFAKYLIDNKIGYVLASPIIQNPSHRSNRNYSLNQGWFWIPPKHLSRAIDTAEAYGAEKFPDKASWIETIGMDLGIPDSNTLLAAVLEGGVFPEDKRFVRTSIGSETVNTDIVMEA